MKKEHNILQIICGLLIILFFYTGVMKIIDHDTFQFDLINAPIISKLSTLVYAVIPSVEVLTAILLLFNKTQKIGLWSSFVLMTVFTIYVGGILLKGGHRPCTCGGVIRAMSWETHLVFNILFTTIALLGIVLNKKLGRIDYKKNNLHDVQSHLIKS
ncbi:Methylamine utilisation protein MauE [Chitinophaga rupis]|uniref:Methylamine utilisation protein MauE n=1 Tax=Chitinophaga rupis TaxID=573321 RepID=A0A1H8IWN4_9BACT|nr:MauE/DoxX family redox-associated membrane protein [Chitinophaga rupis]SEN72108.1 Methylamine utilisation protein MauE [Chitinophaga rupis]